MSTGGLVFFLGLLALIALIIGAPVFRRHHSKEDEQLRLEKQRERLLVYYERVLNNLRDLDEDHATGKMPDEAYAQERESWMQRGVQVLKAVDRLEEESIIPSTVHDDVTLDEAIDREIEATIAAYRSS